MRYLKLALVTIEAVRERERESYSLNKVNFACVIPSILNKNKYKRRSNSVL